MPWLKGFTGLMPADKLCRKRQLLFSTFQRPDGKKRTSKFFFCQSKGVGIVENNLPSLPFEVLFNSCCKTPLSA